MLYVQLIWGSGFPEIYAWLEEGGRVSLSWSLCGVVVFQRSMLNWKGSICHIWAHFDIGICAFCYLWQLFGVLVFQRSMLDWRRGVHLPHMSTMCILLYMKLIWCNGFPEIYAQLEEGGGPVCQIWAQCAFCYIWNLFVCHVFQKSMLIWGGQIWAQCAFCYIGNLFGVMDFQKSMLNWGAKYEHNVHSAIHETYLVSWFSEIYAQLEGVHLPNMSTMCILLYRKLIWCHGFPEIYAQLGGPNMSTMCILLHMKLIWCHGFPEIYAQLGGQIWAQCAFCYTWNLFGVMVFQRSMLDWRGPSAKYEHNVHSAI